MWGEGRMRLKIYAISALMLLSVSPARANVFGELWGVITDPFKISKGSENVLAAAERTMIHLERIQQQLGNDANVLLDKVDKTISDTRRDVSQMIDLTGNVAKGVTDNAFLKLSALQTSMITDVRNLVKCSTEVTLYQTQAKRVTSAK